jgi:hypothetical protein
MPFAGQPNQPQQPGYVPQQSTPGGGVANLSAITRKKGLPPMAMLIGGGAVLIVFVVLVIVFVGGLIGGGSASTLISGDYVAYVKDGELSVAGINSLASFEASEDLLPSGTDSGDVSYYMSDFNRLVQINKNGNMVFFPDRMDDDTYSLYQRSVSGGGKNAGDAVRIDTDLRGVYKVSDDGKKILYIKSDDQNLFMKSGNDERVKIDSDVVGFLMDKSGSMIYYTQRAEDGSRIGTIYYKNRSEAPEKIDSVSELLNVSEDFQTIYYLKENTLYSKKTGEQKVKIAGGVTHVFQIYDSGEMYYASEDSDGDDNTMYTLCYNDGKLEATSESKLGQSNNSSSSEEFVLAVNPLRPAIVFRPTESESGDGNDESEDDNNDSSASGSSRDKKPEYKLSIKNTVSTLDISDLDISESYIQPFFTNDGNMLYYMDDNNIDRDIGSLFCVELEASGFKPPVSVYEDISRFGVLSTGSIYYYQDINRAGTAADLYVDGKLADSDVFLGSAYEVNDSGRLIYYTDYNTERRRGSLKILEGGKPTLISDDVASSNTIGGKNIAYLVREGSSSTGDLIRYDGSKDRKPIDTDVALVLSVYFTGAVATSLYY